MRPSCPSSLLNIGMMLCGLALAGCANGQWVSPGKPASVHAPYGFLVIGIDSKHPVEQVRLCSKRECVDIGPFESWDNVLLVRVRADRYCLEGYELVVDSKPMEFSVRGELPACMDIRAEGLTYYGHIVTQFAQQQWDPLIFTRSSSAHIGWRRDIDELVHSIYPQLLDSAGNELHVEVGSHP